MIPIEAITVWQPWATLIAENCKPFEFRSWAAPARLHGRRIGIHAGARKVSVTEVRALLVKLYSMAWRDTGLVREPSIELLEKIKVDPTALPLSSVVCTALLGPPIRDGQLMAKLGLDRSANDSNRDEHSNWGWPLLEVERLKPPLPARGRQGFWRWRAA